MIKKVGARLFNAALIALISIITSCRTSPQVRKFSQQLATNSFVEPTLVSLANETPIIDIHTHTFNALDLPLQNIVLGRRDAFPPWTWLIGDDTAKFLAAVIVAETEPEPDTDRSLHREKSRVERVAEKTQTMDIKQSSIEELTNRTPYKAAGKALDYKKSKEVPHLSLKERIVLRSIAAYFGYKHPRIGTSIRNVLNDVSPFLGDLTLSNVELLRQYAHENATNIQFRISHMMDMGPTYGQEPGEAGLRSFDDQISYIADLQKDPSAHMAYFVAYNPFRDNSHPGEALHIVQDAISNHFAYGVKIYPPAGYRPISNDIPSRPHFLLSAYPGSQWDSRYGKTGNRISNGELDSRLLSLLCWCASNNIPVFAHSGYGEFQARSGYGEDMPNPYWWGMLLTNMSTAHPELTRLRLCFGHSGGADGLFGETKHDSWSAEVCELCRKFPNVYCEVGCLDQIMNTNKQAVFAANMETLCNLPTDEQHRYSFASKIMYGSDWYMPITGDRHDFLAQYQRVFLLPELQRFYKQFFLGNALEYLNANGRIKDEKFPIDPMVKAQLQHLLAKATQ